MVLFFLVWLGFVEARLGLTTRSSPNQRFQIQKDQIFFDASPGSPVWTSSHQRKTLSEGSLKALEDEKILPRGSRRAGVIGEATRLFNDDHPVRYPIPVTRLQGDQNSNATILRVQAPPIRL